MKNAWITIFLSGFLILNFFLPVSISAQQVDSSSSTGSILSFYPNVLLSTSDSVYPQHVEPTMAIGSNNEIYVGWKDALLPDTAGVDVSFTKSTDNGSTWTTPVSMPSNITKIETSGFVSKSDPWLNVFNNTVYYSYLEYNASNSISQVSMAKSTDSGSSWTVNKASENINFADKESFIISDNGTIYLTYDDVNLQNSYGRVMLSKSVNGGTTFKDVSQVNFNDTGVVLAPYPALSTNHTLYVAWLKFVANGFGDVYYASSTDGGLNFSTDQALNPGTNYATSSDPNTPGKSTIPVAMFDGKDRLYVLWAEYNQNWKIYLRYSDDFGLHWSPKIAIHDVKGVNQWEPDMAIDSQNNLHIAWLEESGNSYRPYYREISFSGTNRTTITMSKVIPVATTFTNSKFTRPGDYLTIRVDSYNLPHVVWTDGRSGHLEIYYAHGSSKSAPSSIPGFIYPVTLVTIGVLVYSKRKK